MTIQLDGMDVMALAEAATVVGGIISMLVVGLLIYLLVRPPRHVRQARREQPAMQESEAEEMLRMMDRMEARLEVLERLVVEPAPTRPSLQSKILEPAEDGRETRRNQ
jgi:hypothetical protein